MEIQIKHEGQRHHEDCSGQASDPTTDRQASSNAHPTLSTMQSSSHEVKDSELQHHDGLEQTIGSTKSKMIKKEMTEEDEQPMNCNHSNRRCSPEDCYEESYSRPIYDEESSFTERFVDGEITIVRIPSAVDVQLSSSEDEKLLRRDHRESKNSKELTLDMEQYAYHVNRVPIVYPMQVPPTESRNGSPSPNGYRLDESNRRSSPISEHKYYQDNYWQSESPREKEGGDGDDTNDSSCSHTQRVAEKKGKALYSTYVPEISNRKITNGCRKDVKRDRLSSRDHDEKEEESLWKQVQRYRHRKRPVLGKLPIPSQEDTIFMQYNEIRERRIREGRYVSRSTCRRHGTSERGELPHPSSPQNGGESLINVFGSSDHVTKPIVVSSNRPMRGSGDKDEKSCDDDANMCSRKRGLSSNEIGRSMCSLEQDNGASVSKAPSNNVVETLPHSTRDTISSIGTNFEMHQLEKPISPPNDDFSHDKFHRQENEVMHRMVGRESKSSRMMEYRDRSPHWEMRPYSSAFDDCGEYNECHCKYGDRRQTLCNHHCCYPSEARVKRKRRRLSEPDYYQFNSDQEKTRKPVCEADPTREGGESSSTQDETGSFSPASSDSREVEIALESDSRTAHEDQSSERRYTLHDPEISDIALDRLPGQVICRSNATKEMNDEDTVCQVNGLFSLPGYRETKYNISLGELKRRIGQPETLTRVEMISYVRQAKTSGRILLDKNGITTSNRSHPSIMSRVCEREAQVLACGLHKMNMEYLPLSKMVQKCVGMYKSRGCDGCQDCRLRLRRRIVDVEITRNMLKELLRTTQESSLDGVLDTFDLASHTFGIPNLTNNIKLIDEYFKLLLLSLENE